MSGYFNLVKTFDELKVEVVISKLFIFLFFSKFIINGTILFNSPTLHAWNHIKFPLGLFKFVIENFSLNLIISSFFF